MDQESNQTHRLSSAESDRPIGPQSTYTGFSIRHASPDRQRLHRAHDLAAAIGRRIQRDLPVAADRSDTSSGIEVPNYVRYAAGMYMRTRSSYPACRLLLRKEFFDEAMTVGRSLFEDSVRLAILAEISKPEDRVDGLVAWALDGIQRAIGLYHEASQLDIGAEHDAAIQALEDERRWAIDFRNRWGSGRKSKVLMQEQELEKHAKETNRADAWWLHEVADQLVHGNLFAHMMRTVALDAERATGFAIRVNYPGGLLGALGFAAESAVVAHEAMCALVDHGIDPVIRELLTEIESIQEAFGSS